MVEESTEEPLYHHSHTSLYAYLEFSYFNKAVNIHIFVEDKLPKRSKNSKCRKQYN